PGPAGRGGCVYTARIRWPAAISPARIVAANSGVPMKTRSSGWVTKALWNPPPHPGPLRPRGRRGRCGGAHLFPLRPSGGRGRGPARSAGRVRWATKSSGGLQRAAALCLGELFQDHPALQDRDVIDKQDAVQMIDLVLQTGREQSFGLDLADLVLVVEIAQPDCPWPRD